MNFLRPATLEAGALRARCDVLRRGKRIALCRALVRQRDELVAEGLFTYLFTRARA